MRYLLFISLTVTLLNCNSQTNSLDIDQRLVCDELLKQNDSILKEKYGYPLNEAYYKQIQQLRKANSSDQLGNNHFSRDENFYVNLLEVGIFNQNKVRVYSNQNKKIEKETFKYEYDLSFKGNYLNFLIALSKNNKLIDKYHKDLLSAGTISPVTTAMIIHDITENDLKNSNVRLVLGIHFLLLNQKRSK